MSFGEMRAVLLQFYEQDSCHLLQVSRRRTEGQAKLIAGSGRDYRLVPGTSLKVGDVVLVEAGDNIPSDGEVIEGVASVNEAAITGVCVANTSAEIDDHVLAV